MKEVEVKILEVNRPALERKLKALGARKSFKGALEASYYDFPDMRMRKSGCTLRIRKEGKKSIMTLKTFVSDKGAKTREETGIEVSKPKEAVKILQAIGLKPWLNFRKIRTSYAMQGAHFDFDKYQGTYAFIPEFMEIEAPDVKTVKKYAKILGFNNKECKVWGFFHLVEFYSKFSGPKTLFKD